MVRGRDGEGEGGVKSNGAGPKGEKTAQSDRRFGGSRDRGFTRLSYQELMERKQKGLCFKCKGPFHPMHQCPERQLKVLVFDGDDEDEAEAKV
ncbi:RNA-directed DNA polymerase (Reverse transcriptase), partial [Trifolium medium]|nr:RNA-directed DNA polymerase (Reverse transcriptase) [Trifolium medium]